MNNQEVECCDLFQVHPEVVDEVRGHLPPEEELADLADLFKVFGDSTRIKILFVLFERGVRVRYCTAAGYDSERDFSSTACSEAKSSGKKPPGRQKRAVLLSG